MKLFKNFKTKKQLRAEIERLKAVHERPPIIKEHVEVQKLYASYLADNQLLDMVESDISEKYAKSGLRKKLCDSLFRILNTAQRIAGRERYIEGYCVLSGRNYET